ncbi:MAG: hypothetical protein M3N18_03565 [Actinomycetota bacterium]|nr:hypothetical protein [Actinomycetota bacterium]
MAKKKDFGGDPGGLIGDAIFGVIKPIYKEGEKARRARSTRRTYYAPEPKVSQKEIVFRVLPTAIRNAGALFSARDLYYATRPLAYAHYEWEDGKQLDYRYFSQALLTEYQEQRGPIEGLWRDPRGNLHEPHTAKALALGTREVASYQFPEYTFDKILYVEKEGEWPKLQAARLAERYDMAIASAKGYPVEAVRELFAQAEGGEYQLSVFHDADVDGYNIARVMREATRRMPHHRVDVVDIGLTVEDALEMGLDSEPFSRSKRIPYTLRRRLSGVAEEYFVHREERFELNAILPDTRRIEYIERKLKEHGVRGKVIPPDGYLREKTAGKYADTIDAEVERVLNELLSAKRIKRIVRRAFRERHNLPDARRWIEEAFKEDGSLSWRVALDRKLAHRSGELRAEVREAVEKSVRKMLAE